jgi:hypothetical protein
VIDSVFAALSGFAVESVEEDRAAIVGAAGEEG